MVLDGHPVLILVCARHVSLEPRYDLSDKDVLFRKANFPAYGTELQTASFLCYPADPPRVVLATSRGYMLHMAAMFQDSLDA